MNAQKLPLYISSLALCLTFATACEDIKPPSLDGNNSATDTGFEDTDTGELLTTVKITQSPDAETDATSATFEFECNASACEFECSLDDAEFKTCTSPHYYNDLQAGRHKFAVRAVLDNGSFSTPAQHNWTITAPKPFINISQKPDSETYFRTAYFDFTCTSNLSSSTCKLTCSLNDKPAAPCPDTKTYTNLELGEHKLTITATDTDSNQQTSVDVIWTILPLEWTSISAGKEHTCAILADDTLWCWGNNANGRTGLGTSSESSNVPKQVTGSWKSVSAGEEHTCAINTAGALFCWGNGRNGRLGTGNEQSTATPTKVVVTAAPDNTDWTKVSAGKDRTCAIKSGNLYCWGYNSSGVVTSQNLSTVSSSSTPLSIGNSSDWSAIAVGDNHTCGIQSDTDGNILYCWGSYGIGSSDIPKKMENYLDTHSVSAGANHTCIIYTSLIHGLTNSLVCFSDGNYLLIIGEDPSIFQDGILKNHGQPWSAVSAGQSHTCAIQKQALHCWGPMSTKDTNNNSWLSVASGAEHSCAISTDNQAYCWGKSNFGQTGTGTDAINIPFPTPVAWPY